MRKFIATMATGAFAVATAAVLATASPADAACPGRDGTVPGSGPRVVAAGPIYIDDRDFTDTDDGNDDAGGFWVYLESGAKPGLQRGGDQIVFATMAANGADPSIPTIGPIVTPVITLFPNGFGGGSISETVGFHDDCVQDTAKNRDYILV